MRLDPQYNRPTEVDLLLVHPSKSKKLGWKPQYDLTGLVNEMVAFDLALF